MRETHGSLRWRAPLTRVPEAPKTAREIKAHAPHSRVIFTVFGK